MNSLLPWLNFGLSVLMLIAYEWHVHHIGQRNPEKLARYANAKAPILGLYGGNDNRVNANIDLAKTELGKKKVDYEPHIFDGAGHGFLRQQSGGEQAPGNMKATEQAWPLVLTFLKKHLG